MKKSKNITIEIPNEYTMIRLTAKLHDVLGENQPNRKDAIAFLNKMSLAFHTTAEYFSKKGMPAMAEEYKNFGDAFFTKRVEEDLALDDC